ncbi:phosphoglycerate kinase [Clostridium magnum]|uniref:Phosphoglycerate kinase n=1 Tax=Clostridium magnum DSM 2767 TaxID=1121326 RepID=A0A162QZP0_9CLOT|nr:phosphoglycerate kinase [Clostridium magnum]KZL89201.1 phosphoglycerate kinase [Clostridium magnum DSM 2767]SHJ35415.1 phosphoglycerate kinase [Clostridium magnum DSM 2767]
MDTKIGIKSIEEFNYKGKTVLLRLDINSPIDPETKKIVSENRIKKSLPTLNYLIDQGAKIAIIAHQGDTLDYQNLIPMEEHAEKLSKHLGREVRYIDDVCGPAAIEEVNKLKEGQLIFLGNLRYLTEEISTFEDAVKLEAKDMLNTYLVRSLAPVVDCYVNDAFAAAHRNAPSMVAFQEILPTAAGLLMFKELSALTKVMKTPDKPSVFVLGGLKISDAFGMMKQVLENGSADKILCSGITGHIMLIAKGYNLGQTNLKFIKDRNLDVFVKPAKEYLDKYGDKIICPIDLAYEEDGERKEIGIEALPTDKMCMDIGHKTIEVLQTEIAKAGTIFVNGPAGVYESKIFEDGTKAIWNAIAEAKGYSVIGGGDTVSAAQRFIDTDKINYVCTAGGAMVRFLSGVEMPLIKAMKNAFNKTL